MRRSVSGILVLLCGPLTWACPASSRPDPAPSPVAEPEQLPAPPTEPTQRGIAPPREAPAPKPDELEVRNFEDAELGGLPSGFRVAETGGTGTPAVWRVGEDPTAPSPTHVFGIAETRNRGQTYNLALLEGEAHADVDVGVMVKADRGEQDRGGGLAFRIQDPDNYYVARWNPLEKNARFYVVEGGSRSALGKADLELDPEQWHALRVLAVGDRLELFVGDASVLVVEDQTHTAPGGVGLWTKADAATWFDDLTVSPP